MNNMPLRHRFFLVAALATSQAWLVAGTASAATPAAAPAKAATRPAAKPAPRPAAKATLPTTRQQANSTAKGLALATQATEAISAGQLDVAARVLTGAADCEFNQRINVQALAGQPGMFTVSHQGRHYRMLPRETSTGAVRLEDPSNGIVWLQIPAKSMLMNARRGQRMVDSCMHAEQRAAVAAASDAGQGIGIVAPAQANARPAVPAASATAPVTSPTPSPPSVAMEPPAAMAPAASAP
jgi:hypothetical protein